VPCQRSYVAQGTGFSSGGGRISLKYRIASAESRLRVLSPGLRVVSISGGLTDGIADIATFGDEVVERSPDETIEDFQCRARALAIAAGSRSLVFGGLPGTPMDDDGMAPRRLGRSSTAGWSE
jgi:hypothetical protein